MSPTGRNATAPRIARHLLWRLLPANVREPVIGDFEELYTLHASRRGSAHAALWYWGQTFQSVVACFGGKLTEGLAEGWGSVTAAYRTLLRERRSTIVSIAGLTMALAVAIFISAHIGRELGFDRYHEKSDRIFRVAANLTLGGTPNAIASTNAALAPAMANAFPGVSTATRVRPLGSRAVRHADRLFYEERILLADDAFFDVFSFPFLAGDPALALREPGSIVVTERTAELYFGRDEPLGRRVQIGAHPFTVTGVIENVPLDSHFVFDMLCSMAPPARPSADGDEDGDAAWLGPFVNYTYVVLDDADGAPEVERQLAALVDEVAREEMADAGASADYFLQPLTSIHLGSHLRHELAPNGRAAYLLLWAAVAGAMLLLASFNLVNLARERWAARVQEIGGRRERVRQFVTEAMLFSLSALVLALALVYVLFPFIGPWLATDHVAFAEGIASMSPEPDRHLGYASQPWLIPAFLALAVALGLAAGCYPAIFGAGDRGDPRRYRGGMRRLLLGTQLAVSLVMLIAAIGVVRQVGHLEDVRLGFDKRGVVVIPLVAGDLQIGVDALEARLASVPGVIAVGAGSHVPGQRPSGGAWAPEGFADGRTAMMDGMSVDAGYLETLGIEIVAGRGFSVSDPATDNNAVLVNTTAVEAFGWHDAIGKTIRRPGEEAVRTIVGVVRDFHFSSAHRRIGPIVVERRQSDLRSLVVKVESDGTGMQERLEAALAALDPDRPFKATLLELSYDRQYTAERNLGRLFALFSVLSIVITALGLFGVAPLFGNGRWIARCRELLTLCVVASLVALPVAWVLLQRWLQSFPTRSAPGVGVFALAALLLLAIGFAVLSAPAGRRRDDLQPTGR